ncbi:NUDIX domain-containing protein [Longispora albida]|uniref:NUDIX domain-containing protein n=1 Tax=Longispora albida TaxID=203523 RepID=UPI00036A28E6|nr:NUDIX domain-containing protein [Longispora albida]
MEPHHGNRFELRVTGRAIVFREGSVLLTASGAGQALWHLPGGGIDPGETAAEATIRELAEECDLEVVLGDLAFVRETTYPLGDGAHRHRIDIVHTATTATPEAARLGPEPGHTTAVAWIPLGELDGLDLRPPELARLLPRLAAGQPIPRYLAGREAGHQTDRTQSNPPGT